MQLLNKQLAYPCRVCYNHNRLADVAEWQTHQTQNLAVVTSCGFKSHHPHTFLKQPEKWLFFDVLTFSSDLYFFSVILCEVNMTAIMGSMYDSAIIIGGADMDRNKIVVRTSLIGIITNVLLAGFKAAVGLFSNSIAVVLDAVNNLSDALSSVITIVGTKLASRKPDRKHPMGHGRIEYLSAMIVAAIVLYAGITSAVESVKKIITPEVASYTTLSLIIIAVAVVVKIVLGTYVKKQGEKAGSAALTASGQDARFDAILSFSVLVSALIYMLWGVSLEAYVGLIISGFIIKAGVEMLLEPLDDILGHRSDPEVTKEVKRLLTEEPEVYGAYDLFLTNYGPARDMGSVHIEVADTMTAAQIDVLTRRLQMKILKETGIILTGIGIYSYNTQDDEASRLRNEIQKIVMSHEWALQMHGFYADIPNRKIQFDVVMSFDIEPAEGLKTLHQELAEAFPDYQCFIASDLDISD